MWKVNMELILYKPFSNVVNRISPTIRLSDRQGELVTREQKQRNGEYEGDLTERCFSIYNQL